MTPFNGDQVLACEKTGVLPCVPKALTSGNTKRGLFTGQDFIYDAEKDQYTCPDTCPAGQHLSRAPLPGRTIALALSSGGMRAMAFHAGVLRWFG